MNSSHRVFAWRVVTLRRVKSVFPACFQISNICCKKKKKLYCLTPLCCTRLWTSYLTLQSFPLHTFKTLSVLLKFQSLKCTKLDQAVSNRGHTLAHKWCWLTWAISSHEAPHLGSSFVFDKLLVYWPHTDKGLPVLLGSVSSVHKWDCEKVRLVFTEVLM